MLIRYSEKETGEGLRLSWKAHAQGKDDHGGKHQKENFQHGIEHTDGDPAIELDFN